MYKQYILSISVDKDLSNMVRKEAFKHEVSISQYVRDILLYFIEHKDRIDFYKKNTFEPIDEPKMSLWKSIKGLFRGDIVFLRKKRDIF